MRAINVYELICSVSEPDENVLIIPKGMEFTNLSSQGKKVCRKFNAHFDDVLSFGVWDRKSTHESFATSPTWILYKGLDKTN